MATTFVPEIPSTAIILDWRRETTTNDEKNGAFRARQTLPKRERARSGNLHANKARTKIPSFGKMFAHAKIMTHILRIMQIIHLAEIFLFDKQHVNELTERRHGST
jgi:hypothetical protein